ncbi:MAG: methyl-accepting chemotaxis protein [Sulfurimonas sp.]|jgi:methyl-accepting chemotaxis protein
MFGFRKKDKNIIINAIDSYHSVLKGTKNEYDFSTRSTNHQVNEILDRIAFNTNEVRNIRNANNILVGELVISFSRTNAGEIGMTTTSDNTKDAAILFQNSLSSYNNSMSNLKKFFETIKQEFIKISDNDFRSDLKSDDWGNDLKHLMENITSMSQVIVAQSKLQLKNSISLQENANTMLQEADKLAIASNQQASSLEETAAAIEELTSNVSANTAKAEEMASTTRDAKESAEKGNQVAQNSLEAMHEIYNATEAINNAVEIIDNIAFQTNILSLNAAVEAATAGDAGKGFAVVAQEVRNLANRSADAAKQIQTLAKEARQKSEMGLQTTQNMKEEFVLIFDKISQTDRMVQDMTAASHEQMVGIVQINNAVAQLDQITQANARTASNVNENAIIINEIAHVIFNDANKKEFVDKQVFLNANRTAQYQNKH